MGPFNEVLVDDAIIRHCVQYFYTPMTPIYIKGNSSMKKITWVMTSLKTHLAAFKKFLPNKVAITNIPHIEIILLLAMPLSFFIWEYLTIGILLVILWLYQPIEYLEHLKHKWNSLLDVLFDVEYKDGFITTEYFLSKIESGEWFRKMVCGVSDKLQDFLVVDPKDAPGILLIGGMGSGKSTTGKGIVCTSLATSSKCAVYIIVDVSDKGAGDYTTLFKYKDNVATALYEKQKLVPVFNMAYEELVQRAKRFKNMYNSANFLEYEDHYRKMAAKYKLIYEKIKTDPKSLSQEEKEYLQFIANHDQLIMSAKFNRALMDISNGVIGSDTVRDALYDKEFVGVAQFNIIMEEFHSIPSSKEVEFMENHATEGTIAYMLKQLGRTGRSFGFNLIPATQRCTYTEVPNDIKAGLTTTLCHRVNSPNDAQTANLPHAAEIKAYQRGRAAYEDGFVQYPYFSGASMERLVDKYYIPNKGELFAYKMADYHKALSGTGSDGMVLTMPLKFIITNNQMFTTKKIVERILPIFGFQLIEEDLTSLDINAVAMKNGHKYGIMIINGGGGGRGGFGRGPSSKKMENFKTELTLINADRFLVFSFEKGESSVRISDIPGIVMDFEDLIKMADIIDNQETTKVLGTFEKLFSQIPLNKDLDTVAPKEAAATGKKSAKSRYEEDDDFMKKFGV